MSVTTVPLSTHTVHLYGRDEDFTSAKRPALAALFGHMVKLTRPVTQNFVSDLYHDAHWLDEFITGETEFHWMARLNGTNIGESAIVQEHITFEEPRDLYHVRITNTRGQWDAQFTLLVSVRMAEPSE